MENKTKKSKSLFVVLLVLFVIGVALSFALKYTNALLVSRTGEPGNIVMRRTLTLFGEEAVPLWLLPSMVLNWISVRPRELLPYALRWLPYLITFLLPVFCGLVRKKAIFLIPCAAVSCIVAIGFVLTRVLNRTPLISYANAIPFAVEAILLILACVALATKKKGFCVALGVVCLLLTLLSLAATPFYSGLDPKLFQHFAKFGQYLSMRLRRFPDSFASSYWPIHKAFSFLMYALILFSSPKQFLKRS